MKQLTDRILFRNPENNKKVWTGYEPDESDLLTLCATIEPVGALYAFEGEDERKGSQRKMAWNNAIHYAELLYRQAPHRQYVVSLRQADESHHEVIHVYMKTGDRL